MPPHTPGSSQAVNLPESHPAPKSSINVLIGTWNLKNFTLKVGNDWHRPKLESIARTILQRKLSLTALQEVSSKDTVEHLASELTRQDDNAVWRQRVSGDLRRSSDGVAEYAAFLWKPAVNKVGGVNLWSDHVAEGSDSVYRLHTIPLSLKRSPFYGLFSLNGLLSTATSGRVNLRTKSDSY